jgi:hypothetical protein
MIKVTISSVRIEFQFLNTAAQGLKPFITADHAVVSSVARQKPQTCHQIGRYAPAGNWFFFQSCRFPVADDNRACVIIIIITTIIILIITFFIKIIIPASTITTIIAIVITASTFVITSITVVDECGDGTSTPTFPIVCCAGTVSATLFGWRYTICHSSRFFPFHGPDPITDALHHPLKSIRMRRSLQVLGHHLPSNSAVAHQRLDFFTNSSMCVEFWDKNALTRRHKAATAPLSYTTAQTLRHPALLSNVCSRVLEPLSSPKAFGHCYFRSRICRTQPQKPC